MTQVGFIGLGLMGKPMALNLMKASYSMCVLEKNKAAGELVGARAHSFKTIRSSL